MRSCRLLGCVVALILCSSIPTFAAFVPWSNTNGVAPGFTWSGGGNDTNLFGSPLVVGNQFIFTPNAFIATSQNGVAANAHDTMQVDITINPGFVLQQVNIYELGDYQITGTGTVNAGGSLVLVDTINGGLPSIANLLTTPAMPQTGQTAGALIWSGSATAALGANTTSFKLTLNNILDAISGSNSTATIQKKFASGVVIEIIVPEPTTLALLSLGAPVILARRRRR